MTTPPAMDLAPDRPKRRGWLWPVVAVAALAALVRLWATGGLSLIVTNDGTGYIQMAERFARGEGMQIGVLRTPGYPAMLGVVVWMCGTSPVAVLLFHHAMGTFSAGVVAFAGVRLAGQRTGTIVGSLFALDPWLLGLESYLLTEAAAVAAMVAVVAFALCARGTGSAGWVWRGIWLGMMLGAACLIRPAMQSAVPFVVLGWVLRCAFQNGWVGWRLIPLRTAAATGITVVVAFGAVSAPWLRHNAERGVRGFARGTELVPWLGFAANGLLDDSYPLDELMAKEYATFKTLPVNDFSIWQFYDNIQALSSLERLKVLGAWCKESALKQPGKYAKAVAHAAAWQLNIFPKAGAFQDNETRRYLRGLGVDATQWNTPAPNLYTAGVDPAVTKPLQMWGSAGPLRSFAVWFADKVPEGLHQVPLFAFGVIAGLRSLLRRDWGSALVFAGIMAFWGAHVAMLSPYSRYAMPAWGAWYIAIAYCFVAARSGARAEGSESQGRADAAVVVRPFKGVDGRVEAGGLGAVRAHQGVTR